MALEDRLDRPHGLHGALARQRVLHLREAHEPRAGEDAVASGRRARAASPRRRRTRLSAGIAAGKRRPARHSSSKAAVVDHHLPDPLAQRGGGAGGASVGVFVRVSATSQCGKVQNSKCVVALGALLQVGEHVLERLGAGRRPCSAKAGTQRSVTADHRAERPEADARGAQQVAVGARERPLLPARQHELHRLDLGGEVRVAQARAVRAGGQRAARASGRRCRRGWAARARARRGAALSASSVIPASTRTRPVAAVGVQHPVEPARARAACRPSAPRR